MFWCLLIAILLAPEKKSEWKKKSY
jgi:hypothetical protein